MKTFKRYYAAAWLVLGLVMISGAGLTLLQAQENPLGSPADAAVELKLPDDQRPGGKDAIYYAIAITMGASCLAAGYAVAQVGAAALGVISEKPELMGRVLIFVGLAEGIAIYGLIIAIMLMGKL